MHMQAVSHVSQQHFVDNQDRESACEFELFLYFANVANVANVINMIYTLISENNSEKWINTDHNQQRQNILKENPLITSNVVLFLIIFSLSNNIYLVQKKTNLFLSLKSP